MNFHDLRNWMAGESCLVVGCGPSAETIPAWPTWSIGCNRAVLKHQTQLAVCIEPFRDKHWAMIRKAHPLFVFSHIHKDRNGKAPCERIVQIPGLDVHEWFGVKTGDPLKLAQSPFYAAAIAVWLGFRYIDIIGVDLTEDRWPEVFRENDAYARLANLARGHNSYLVNVSHTSRLTSIPFSPTSASR